MLCCMFSRTTSRLQKAQYKVTSRSLTKWKPFWTRRRRSLHNTQQKPASKKCRQFYKSLVLKISHLKWKPLSGIRRNLLIKFLTYSLNFARALFWNEIAISLSLLNQSSQTETPVYSMLGVRDNLFIIAIH